MKNIVMKAAGLLALTLALSSLFVSTASAQIDFSAFEGDEQIVDASALLSRTKVAPGTAAQAAVVIDIAEGWHINSAQPREDYLIPAKIEIEPNDFVVIHSINYPAGDDIDLQGGQWSVYHGRAIITIDFAVDDIVEADQITLPIKLTYQACNDRECRGPKTIPVNLNIPLGTDGVAANTSVFESAAITPEMEAETAPPVDEGQEQNKIQQLVDSYGLWGYFMALGLAFVTGLLLSFSPCTYPMIPITVSIFGGQQRSVGRGFILSLFYVGSMAVVYGLMGLVVSLVGGVFGAWLASPPVVITIAVVFVIFSLSMFGLYELNVPMSLRQKLGTAKTGGGVIGAIILGIVAALVVSPCVGPFVAGILLYVATNGSPVIGFLVLFFFAIGLGTLYIIIGTFSSAINALPNSGEWMEQVKKFFGFVLLMMAIYFLQTLISPTLTAILTGLLLLAFGVFGGGLDRLTPESGFFPRLKKLLGLLALLVGIYLVGSTMLINGFILPPASEWLPVGTASSIEKEEINWGHDLESGLTEALQNGQPVLIDTWATWCANCRVLERKTFGRDEIIAESKRFKPLKIQLEKADTPETIAFMQKFNLKHYSLPTTLLIDSEGNVRKIMQGVVEPDVMLREMQAVH